MLNKSDKYANIKYEDRQTKTVPSVKFNSLFGLNICHKNGTEKRRIK